MGNLISWKQPFLILIVLKLIHSLSTGHPSVEIHPHKKIYQQVSEVQQIECIFYDIKSEVSIQNQTKVSYHVSCERPVCIIMEYRIRTVNQTSNESMKSEVNIDCKQHLTKLTLSVLNPYTIALQFSSQRSATYQIICRNDRDRYDAYTRVQFGYPPLVSKVDIEKDVYDFINIFVTPQTVDEDMNLPYIWNIKCQCSNENRLWYPCERKESNGTWYKLARSSANFFSFSVTGRSLFGIYSKTFNYSIWKIPIRIPDFEDIEETILRDSIQLKLTLRTIPVVVMLRKQYKVWFRSERDPQGIWKIITSEVERITLKELHPFTKYTILACARERSSSIWNKNVTLIIKTKPAAPSAPPQTTPGSYFENICPHNRRRCVTVFWQSLPVELRNDILLGYCVQHINGKTSANNTEELCLNSNNLTVDSLYKDFQHLPWNQTLTFSIVAVTKSKRVSPPAYIQVKNTGPAKPKVVYVRKVNDSWYNVSWLLQPDSSPNVTVFWCKNKIMAPRMECMEWVQWKSVSNVHHVLVQYRMGSTPAFAAYVSSETGSSPLTSAKCVFIRGKRTQPPQPIVSWSESEFVVKWPYMSCSQWNGIPEAYVVSYAAGNTCNTGKKQEFPVSGRSKESQTIGDLETDTEYSVCLQVKTEEEGLSVVSEVVTGRTKGKENLFYIIIIIIIIILGPFIYILWYLWRCCRQHQLDIKKLDIEIFEDSSSCDSLYTDIQNRGDFHREANQTPLVVNLPPRINNGNQESNETTQPLLPSTSQVECAAPITTNDESKNFTESSPSPSRVFVKVPEVLENCVVPENKPTTNPNISLDNQKFIPLAEYVDENNFGAMAFSDNSNMEESGSRETCFVESLNNLDNISSESTEIKAEVDSSFDKNSKRYVSSEAIYVIGVNGSKSETIPSQNGLSEKSNGSNKAVYVTAFQETPNKPKFEIMSNKENGYVDESVASLSKLEAGLESSCQLKGNNSCKTDVVNEPKYVDSCLNNSDSNSVVTDKNMNRNGPHPDYVFSEPLTEDGNLTA